MNDEVMLYIQAQRNAGVPDDVTARAMQSAGWQEVDIARAFAQANITPKSVIPPVQNLQPQSSSHLGLVFLIVIILFIFASGGAYYYFFVMNAPRENTIEDMNGPDTASPSKPFSDASILLPQETGLRETGFASLFSTFATTSLSQADRQFLDQYAQDLSAAPLTQAKKIISNAKPLLDAFDKSAEFDVYDCDSAKGCAPEILTLTARLVILRSYVYEKSKDSVRAIQDVRDLADFGAKISSASHPTPELLLAGWYAQKSAYTRISKLNAVSSAKITYTNDEVAVTLAGMRKSLTYIYKNTYTMWAQAIDYVAGRGMLPSHLSAQEAARVESYKTMINQYSFDPTATKKLFYDSVTAEISATALSCASNPTASYRKTDLNTDMSNTEVVNYLGKKWYETSYKNAFSLRESLCGVEKALTDLRE